MKILLVEPTKLYQQVISEMLNNVCSEIDIATSGSEGIDHLRQTGYDFILVSKHLPDMHAIEFVYSIKHNKLHSHSTTLIMLTGDDIKNHQDEFIAAGYAKILPKNNFELLFNGILQTIGQNEKKKTNKILYIEDNKSVALAIISLMEKMGLSVDHHTNGELAIASFFDNEYDLVITDVYIEGQLSGIDIVKLIRENKTLKSRVPILAVSIQSDTAMRIKVLNNGANDFINKPIQYDEFRARINNLLALKMLFDQVDKQQKKLFELAMTDQLTGLYNRHSLIEMAPKYFSEAKRHEFPVSLLIIDLDYFKQINDTHGHASGDIVLSQVGHLLKSLCRKEDFAARFGGEEFVILLNHCDNNSACNKAELIREKIENLKPGNIQVTASIGVASAEAGQMTNFNKLFEDADKAVYLAKNNGRNQIQYANKHIAA